ncbi:hypothetical protein Taro_054871 [Colocasia esculenta]|uniref:Uncharacterized protein n=1 Tax=Colocasia esculenta TaxID=4460 RepID=A0A843XRA4_COLES|nr:hypothetical protein [Colocasia esculenta]
MHLLTSSLRSPSSPFFLPNPNCFSSASPNPSSWSSSLPKIITLERRPLSVQCRRSDYYDAQQQRVPGTPEGGSSFASQPPGAQAARVFVGHSIYKGKAALTVEPRAPEFTPLDVTPRIST